MYSKEILLSMTSVWATALATALILFNATNAWANEIYITQSGDGLDLNIDQKGSNNQIKGRTTVDAPIDGANNTVVINQGYEGGNLIQMSIDGANNDVEVNQERTTAGGYDTDSYGYHSSNIEIDGSGNSVDITQRNNSGSSAGHSSNVRFRGDDNSIVTLQTGTGGSNGHLSWVYTHDTESNNTVDIFQNSNSADHKAYVSLYTDGNTVDIDQTGTTQNKAYVLFSSNASGPTDFTLTQNGGDTYGNPDTGSYATISCGSAGGCTVTVNQ
jgi:hypothetical protein